MPSIVVMLEPAACAGQHGAGFDRPAVDMDDAGAALAGVAADMGAGQVQIFAQEMDEEGPVLNICRNGITIDL